MSSVSRARPALRLMGLFALVAASLWAPVPAHAAAKLPSGRSQVRHVFVIVLENESAAVTFGAASPAPYLSRTLTGRGEFVPNYYGVGHNSLDNYIAMISGQAPNAQTQADCGTFSNFGPGALGSSGQQPGTGCVYPADVPTLPGQLQAASLTWRSYNEQMGADPAREATTCGHPAVGSADNTQKAAASDMYATRHDPFVYFHSIIDNAKLCDSHVVGLTSLTGDLRRVASTRNLTFITPDLCDDGHDAPCADGEPGGLAQADGFLRTWVPRITASPAFRRDGLLMVIFDEAATSDASSCCDEIPGPGAAMPGITGPGGGRTGAVLLSPCIAPRSVTRTAYDHYAMLGSVENMFGLSHLGYAGLPGLRFFGSDVLKRPCGPSAPQISGGNSTIAPVRSSQRVRMSIGWKASTAGGTPLAYFQLQQRVHGRWRTLLSRTRRTRYSFTGRQGVRYVFRVRPVNAAGQAGNWSVTTLSGTASSVGGSGTVHSSLARALAPPL